MKRTQILNVLPVHLREQINRTNLDFDQLQEIRIRVGKFIILQYDGQEVCINKEKKYRIHEKDIKEILEYISQYSLFAYEQELKQGYLTIEGGHRVGVTGKAIVENGSVKNLKYINGINIRVAHEKKGCAKKWIPYITEEKKICHTLIISPPRCGKTTLLRDLIRIASDGCSQLIGGSVGVVDERSELASCYHGVPQNDMGARTDILDACPKVEGMMMLIRSMSPQVIAVDEIGMEEDIRAMEYAIHCGCKMIASVHGYSLEEIRQKPVLKELIEKNIFERYIVMTNQPSVGSIGGIYYGNGKILYSDNR